MKRVIVLGGLGLFGRTAVEQLRRLGVVAHSASRPGRRRESFATGGSNDLVKQPVAKDSRPRSHDLQIDANDPASLRAGLRAGDVVIDCAGPFHARCPALVEAAMDVGFDVIDINDDLGYAERVLAMQDRINKAGVRVLSSASTASAVSAAIVRHSTMEPQRVTAFLAPATRHTANAGSARSLIRSVGQPVRLWRNGQLQTLSGWSESRPFTMPAPLGPICGRLFESADALYLPRMWPTLREVAMYVDPNTPGVRTLLRIAARSAFVRRVLKSQAKLATWIGWRLGSPAGGVGYEIEATDGCIARYAIFAAENSFVAAVAPAILAARAIVEDRFPGRGLILPDRYVEPAELFEFLESRGIRVAGRSGEGELWPSRPDVPTARSMARGDAHP